MSSALTKTWWLLALCGVLDVMHAAMNLLMLNPEGSLSLRRFALPYAVRDMGLLALAAGACAIAVGAWNFGKDRSWLLSLHGLALAGFGLIGVSPLVRGPLRFRPVSLLFAVTAISLGAFALVNAQTLRSGASERCIPGSRGQARNPGVLCRHAGIGYCVAGHWQRRFFDVIVLNPGLD